MDKIIELLQNGRDYYKIAAVSVLVIGYLIKSKISHWLEKRHIKKIVEIEKDAETESNNIKRRHADAIREGKDSISDGTYFAKRRMRHEDK